MSTQTLPTPGNDVNTWGSALNGYLNQSITPTGFLTTVTVLSTTTAYTINIGSFTYPSISPWTLPNNAMGNPVWTGETLLCNATSNNIAITLPAPPSSSTFNPIHVIKRTDTTYTTNGFTVSIIPAGGATIDGSASTIFLYVGYASITLVTDGTNWYII